jgi:hypothetical protein
LTQKAPYKGLGAESEEKREPVSDIDTVPADSLKALDPDGRLEKRTSFRSFPPPALRERGHRCLAGRRVAVAWRAIFVVPERERPHPR